MSPPGRVGQSASRELARARVVEALRPGGAASRAELARATQLSRVTVSSALAALLHEGLVVEEQAARDHVPLGRGRPPTVFRYNAAARAALGIAFDCDGIRVAIANLALDVVAESHTRLDVRASSFDDVVAAARTAIDHVLATSGTPLERVRGAAVTIPLPIDRPGDRIAAPRIFPRWRDIRPQHVFAEMTGLPTHVENDVNAAAIAERRWGAARDVADFVYVKISPGVGAAIVSDGRLYRGVTGFAGEIGHIRAHEDGPVCGCGNRGCLGPPMSVGSWVEQLRPVHGKSLTPSRLLELLAESDMETVRVVRDASYGLGRALANLSNVLNPAAIVLGNVPAGAEEAILAGTREAINDYALRPIANSLSVRLADLGDRAELLGALALAPLGDPRVPGSAHFA